MLCFFFFTLPKLLVVLFPYFLLLKNLTSASSNRANIYCCFVKVDMYIFHFFLGSSGTLSWHWWNTFNHKIYNYMYPNKYKVYKVYKVISQVVGFLSMFAIFISTVILTLDTLPYFQVALKLTIDMIDGKSFQPQQCSGKMFVPARKVGKVWQLCDQIGNAKLLLAV